MRKRILATVVALAVAVVGSIFALQLTEPAVAAPKAAPVALVAAAVPATPNFGPGFVIGALVPIKTGTPTGEYVGPNGIHQCLPMGPNATVKGLQSIGDYPNLRFTQVDPACDFGASARATTPVTPAGSPVKIVHKTLVLTADSPVTQDLVLAGLPGYQLTTTPYEAYSSNSADIPPAFTTAQVAVALKSTPNKGATTRTFTVQASGLTGTQKFVLDVWAIVVDASA